MIRIDDFQTIVLAIQRAALDPRAWQDVLDHLARVSGGAHTHLFGHHLAAGTGIRLDGALYDPDYMASYDAYYHRLNAWVPGFIGAEVGVPMLTRRLLPHEEFEKTEFYNDWIRPQGEILGGCGMMILREGGRMVALGGNIRRRDAERIEAPFVELVRLLSPHLRHAIDVAHRVGELHVERAALLSGTAPGTALFVLAEDASLVFANAEGLSLLESGTLVRLSPFSEVILAAPAADEAVRAALRRPRARRAAAADVPVAGGTLELRMVAIDPDAVPTLALPIFGTGRPPAALLSLTVRSTAPDKASALASTLGLTPAEAAVARALADGLTPEEIATLRGASVHTVRNQIKSALAKTGARRQAELAALVERLRRA